MSFEVGARKPQPAIYRAALEAVGSEAADAIFVDDQADYCDGARALGDDTRLIVRPDAHPPERLRLIDERPPGDRGSHARYSADVTRPRVSGRRPCRRR